MNKRYQEDLDYFLNFAESERGKELDKKYPNESMHLDFYFLHSKNELKDFINTFLKLHKINDDYDFYYFMNCIIKYMGGHIDAHTRLIMSDNDNASMEVELYEGYLQVDYNNDGIYENIIVHAIGDEPIRIATNDFDFPPFFVANSNNALMESFLPFVFVHTLMISPSGFTAAVLPFLVTYILHPDLI